MDIANQRKILIERLEYYECSFKHRGPEYVNFKKRTVIPRIKRAIAKISLGKYTQCDDCGGHIGEKRLEVIPAALFCIDCQSDSENN